VDKTAAAAQIERLNFEWGLNSVMASSESGLR
jgi:hypothetical protein